MILVLLLALTTLMRERDREERRERERGREREVGREREIGEQTSG